MLDKGTIVTTIICCVCLLELAWSKDNLQMGNEAFAKGDFNKAAEHYRKAIEVKPTFAAYVNLGHSYMRLERWNDASMAYEAVIRLEEESVTAELWQSLGRARFQSKKYEQAMNAFFNASSLKPESTEDNIWIARCMIELEQWIQAQSVLLGQLQREPKNLSVLELLAYVFEQQDNWPGVITIYRELVEIFPERTVYRIALAKALTVQSQNQQAIDVLEFAWRVDASFSEQSNRLLADLYLAEDMPQEAAACYARLIMILENPSFEDYYRLGLAYYQAEELTSAKDAFINMQQEKPTDFKPDLYLGHIEGEKGNLDKAKLHYKAAAEKNPSSAESFVALADLQMKSKIYTDAAANFARAIKLGDKRPQLYYNYILALMNDNDETRVKEALKEALAENPSDTQLIRLLDRHVKHISSEQDDD
jgi:tetratricopeptide (TPR) repeat protein